MLSKSRRETGNSGRRQVTIDDLRPALRASFHSSFRAFDDANPLLFLALSLALAPATANGAETLAQRVLKADAKYLAVKELKPIDTAPKIET